MLRIRTILGLAALSVCCHPAQAGDAFEQTLVQSQTASAVPEFLSGSLAGDPLEPGNAGEIQTASWCGAGCPNCPQPACDTGLNLCLDDGAEQTWVQFTPYVWATQSSGHITVEGVNVPLNLSLSDLWRLLEEGQVRGGFMGHLEFGRDDWSLYLNGDILSFAPEGNVGPVSVETELTMSILELGMTYDLTRFATDRVADSPFKVQMLGGARYYSVSAEGMADFPILGQEPRLAQSGDWVDLLVGARIIAEVSPTCRAFVRGDWGGFGIGTSSTKAWNVLAGMAVDCCWADLIVGYRILDVQETQNGGQGSPDGFGVDVQLQGPVLGLLFEF